MPWWKKLLFSLVTLALIFGLTEAVLVLLGVQPILFSEDPYVGFESRIPLFAETPGPDGAAWLATASNKHKFFNGQRFPRAKSARATRIFCMGGSTTFGHPFDDSTSFCAWLREFLPQADPSRDWQLVNAGGISYASYRVAALMEELVRYEPDAFVIYTGQNEFLERRTYGAIIDTPAPLRGIGALLSRTRTYSAMLRLARSVSTSRRSRNVLSSEVNTILDQSTGPVDYTRDDELRRDVIAHFRFNLLRMIDIARSAGARVVLVTPASNLRDCSPFKSVHKAELNDLQSGQLYRFIREAEMALAAGKWESGLESADRAVAIDDRHAQLHFIRGRLLDGQNRPAEAKLAYQRALDEDICPLRAITEIRDIVREVAHLRDVPIVDFARMADESSPGGMPGDNLFLDHVHPTVEGHRVLALALVAELARQGLCTPSATWGDGAIAQVSQRVTSQVDRKKQGVAMRNVAQVMAWAGKYDDAYRAAKRAVELAPGDGEAHYLVGYMAEQSGNDAEAMEHYQLLAERAIRVQPPPKFFVDAHFRCAVLLVQSGQLEAGRQYFERALLLQPDHQPAREKLVALLLVMGAQSIRGGDFAAAIKHLERVVEIEPKNVDGRNQLGVALIQSGRAADAARHLELAIKSNPRHVPSLSNLGVALIQLKRFDQAEVYLRQALAIAPSYENARRNLERLAQERQTHP